MSLDLSRPRIRQAFHSQNIVSRFSAFAGLSRRSQRDVIPRLLSFHRLLTKAHLQWGVRRYFLSRSHNSGESLAARQANSTPDFPKGVTAAEGCPKCIAHHDR